MNKSFITSGQASQICKCPEGLSLQTINHNCNGQQILWRFFLSLWKNYNVDGSRESSTSRWFTWYVKPGPEVIKLFPCSSQLCMKSILLRNVKMPKIGILTIISWINTTSERLKARNVFICRFINFYEQLKFRAWLSWAWTKFYNLIACFCLPQEQQHLKILSPAISRWRFKWLTHVINTLFWIGPFEL